ncbi:PREDICTED: zinc finger protein ZIC 5-like [Cercocebus atys]|uniref:zinc finger protein ZIC 5-like n=1 Tax=Cercocebus atys TaxID=9531 RepID=UPI0005F56A6E|nr:PREDICTED: zinc finger protein ZIC 5-like [Cercocebus atys]
MKRPGNRELTPARQALSRRQQILAGRKAPRGKFQRVRARSSKAGSRTPAFADSHLRVLPFSRTRLRPGTQAHHPDRLTKLHADPQVSEHTALSRSARAEERASLFPAPLASSPPLPAPPPPPQPPSPGAAARRAGRGRGGVSGGAGPKGGVARRRGQICEPNADFAAEKASGNPDT